MMSATVSPLTELKAGDGGTLSMLSPEAVQPYVKATTPYDYAPYRGEPELYAAELFLGLMLAIALAALSALLWQTLGPVEREN